jgi:two-component system, LytTR family, sensor kinase
MDMKKKRCFEDIAGFNDKWLLIIGLPLATLTVSMLLFTEAYEQLDLGFLAICLPMSFVYTSFYWAGMRRMYCELKWRFPEVEQIGTRVIGVLIGFHVIFFTVNVTLDWFFHWLGIAHDREPSSILKYIGSLILSALVITLYEAISFYVQLQRAEADKAQLERQNVESQLEGLRNQVNPHFLFNSLNTLVYLIPEDANKAVRFVQQLSKVYRYVLESRDAKIIPLHEELEFLQSYIFLLKERFGDNLKVNIGNLKTNPDAAIIPLSLQMLFENAIKHNVISNGKPLDIQVFTDNGHLVVRNNLQKKNQVMDSTGVGLQNIMDRYRMLSAQEVKVNISSDYFSVGLPILTAQPAGAN